MPIQWKRGKNPYVHNSFGVIGVGPNTPRNTALALGIDLAKKVKAGGRVELGGEPLDAQQIAEAQKVMQEDELRVRELLLVHPAVRQDLSKLKDVVRKLHQVALLPRGQEPLPLVHPLAALWFVPPPGAEAALWPPLEDFHLVGPGEPPDLELDIVFDL